MTLLDEGHPEEDVVMDVKFSDIERQHVRVNGATYNLPADGLRLNLENLAREFCYPIDGKLISDYGRRGGRPHTGIDLKGAPGDTIRAAFAGVVRMSKPYSSYGNIVVVRHYNGLETVYSHNQRNLVSSGDLVACGQAIALEGRTGRATTEHLHFEVRAGGEHFDPKLLVNPAQMCLRDGWLTVGRRSGRIVAALSESADSADERLQLLADAETAAAEQAAADRNQAIASSTKKTAAEQQTATTYHTIKNGEVLGTIARKYGTTVSKIVKLNSLKSADRIRSGQKIRVR